MIKSRPLIGILASQMQSDLDILDKVATTYSAALERAGGLPVILPNSAEAMTAYLELVRGIVLIGGIFDVDPRTYGAANAASKDCNLAKDELEIAYVRQCLAKKMPLLGICRGMQIINVACGGTLLQDIRTSIEHHQYPRQEETVHDVIIDGSAIAEDGTYGVNTIHHQGIDQLGHELKAVGRAPDGIIEMIEHASAPMIGVEWHPECLPEEELTQKIFGWLVQTTSASHSA